MCTGSCRLDCEEFRQWCERNDLRPKTVESYLTQIRCCDRWLGETPVWKASSEQILSYMNTKRTSSHKNAVRTALARYGDYRRASGFQEADVARVIPRRKKRRRLPRTLPRQSMPEMLRILPSFGPMVEALILLLTYSALRRNEARCLKWRDIHADYLIVTEGKGGHERMVPLHDALASALTKWQAQCPSKVFVFPSPKYPDRPMTNQWVYNMVKKVGTAANIADCSPHRFRHTAITELYSNTGDILAARDFAGHRSVETTEIYIALASNRTNRAVRQLDFTDPVRA